MLHNGLYEQIINKGLDSELSVTDKLSQTAPIDSAEASKVLAKYVAEIVEKGLNNVKDNGGDLNSQVDLVNRIVSTIMTETKEADFDTLSVAERAEQLLALFDKKNNVLVLDEPTNHLDIDSKEVFEEALLEFPGTAIIVSHDRYFLQRIPTRILELTHEGINEYLGKYDYYVEKKEQMGSGKKYLNDMREESAAAMEAAQQGARTNLTAAEQRALNKKREAEERRRIRHLEKLETEIAELEKQDAELQQQLCCEANMNDYGLLTELSNRRERVLARLSEVYEEWAESGE